MSLALLVNKTFSAITYPEYVKEYDEVNTEWYDAGDPDEFDEFINRVPTLKKGEQIGMKNCSKGQLELYAQLCDADGKEPS